MFTLLNNHYLQSKWPFLSMNYVKTDNQHTVFFSNFHQFLSKNSFPPARLNEIPDRREQIFTLYLSLSSLKTYAMTEESHIRIYGNKELPKTQRSELHNFVGNSKFCE